jgi:hypothetical protein
LNTNLTAVLKFLSFAALSIFFTGCAPDNHHRHHVESPVLMHEYRQHQPDNSWLYWYIIWGNSNSNTNTYYYSSSTPVRDFSSVSFTRSANGRDLPEDVKDQIDKAESVAEEVLTPEEQPSDVKEELAQEQDTTEAQQDAMTNEGGPPPAEVETESSSPSSDSSSGDSGGSDGGGSSD